MEDLDSSIAPREAKAWESQYNDCSVWEPWGPRYPRPVRDRCNRGTKQSFLAHLSVMTLTSESLDSSLWWEEWPGLCKLFFIRQEWRVCPNSLPWPVSWAEGRPSQSVPRARAGSESLSYPGAWGRRANTNSSEGACRGRGRRLVPAGSWATGARGKNWQPKCRDSGRWKTSNVKARPREGRRSGNMDLGVRHIWAQLSA